uniref:C2H2-type domain-containing protein n=1 Tax=Poecilia reticulata TaxID=8081 RepID=A0A3P9PL30_POERE
GRSDFLMRRHAYSLHVCYSDETETPTSSSAEQMKTEPDGEISGGPEPNRELDPSTNLQPNIESYSASSETEVSVDSEDDNLLGCGSENEDSDEDWREPRTRQSGVNREKSSSSSVEKNHSRGKRNGDSQSKLKPGRKYFTCDNCGETFKKLTALKCHIRIHCGEKSVVCKDCGKIFHSRDHFKSHQRLHTGEKPFACDKCGKRFSQEHTLKNHMTCHTGEKPFQCELCDKKLNGEEGGMQKNCLVIHTGKKTFTCDLCLKKFARVEGRKMNKAHGGGAYFCPNQAVDFMFNLVFCVFLLFLNKSRK